MNSANSLAEVYLKFEASSFDLCLYFVLRKDGGAVGVIATQADDVPGCGEPDITSKTRDFLEMRSGKLGGSGEVLCACRNVADPGGEFLGKFDQVDFAKNPEIIPTSPMLWTGSQEPSPADEIKICQCKLGEAC